MKRIIVLALLSFGYALDASAWCASGYTEETCGSLHVCYQGTAPACPSTDPSNSNTNSNTNTNQQSQGQGQSQSQGQGQTSNNSNKNSNKNTATGGTGIGIGYGGSSDATSYAISNATGGEGGRGGAGGAGGSANSGSDSHAVTTQSQTATGGAVTGSGNGGVATVNVGGDLTEAQARNPVNTAFAAPTVVVQSDSCRTGVAGGGQAIAFGFTLSGTQRDENCEVIKLARELAGYGLKAEAVELLRGDERVQAAFDRVSKGRKTVGYEEHGQGYQAKTLVFHTSSQDK